MSEQIVYRPIGVIRSEHTDPRRRPFSLSTAEGVKDGRRSFPNMLPDCAIWRVFRTSISSTISTRRGSRRLIVKPFLQRRGTGHLRHSCAMPPESYRPEHREAVAM